MEHIFQEFLASADTLRVYEGTLPVFTSKKGGLSALLEYIGALAPRYRETTIMDKVAGNAVALLSIKAGGREVYSPLASQLAVKSFDKYGIRYHFLEVVPFIRQVNREAMCPMEALSVGKDPEGFYAVVATRQQNRRK